MKFMCNVDDHSCVTLRLFEPSNVKICGNLFYSPDTNNHLVWVFGLNKNGSRHCASQNKAGCACMPHELLKGLASCFNS